LNGDFDLSPLAPSLQLIPELPLKLEEVVNKALEKDRELRCQTASELKRRRIPRPFTQVER